MNMEKMKEVFSDEAFVKSLFELETAAEVQAALKEKGVELTEEEILGIRDLLGKVESDEISVEQLEQWAAQVESGELSDEMLEQVAGGSVAGVLIIGGVVVGAIAAVTGLAATVTGFIKKVSGRHW